MLDLIFLDRFNRLIAVRIAERKEQFPQECRRLAADLSAKGALRSGAHIIRSRQLHSTEIETRAILTWETLVRVHRIFGSHSWPSLREDFKSLLQATVDADYQELTDSFAETQKSNGMIQQQLSLKGSHASQA